MASRAEMRCTSCGAIGYPAVVRGGPGWLALFLWGGALAAWVGSWYVVALTIVFWVVLLTALIYTMWYFYKQERACRSCGSRTLEPQGGSA